jgi:hypothetical protein
MASEVNDDWRRPLSQSAFKSVKGTLFSRQEMRMDASPLK